MEYNPIDWGTYEGPRVETYDSFIFRRRYAEYAELLREKHGDVVALDFYKAISKYALDNEWPDDLHPEAETYFNLVKAQINRDRTYYKKRR